jgi:acetyl-CoA C-acetyltransferase
MSKEIRDVVILGGARTPVGSFQGALASVPAPRLGAVAVAEAVRRAGIAPEAVDEAILGCVLQGGLGQAPARQAVIFAGLPQKVECVTLHKVCGSGLKSIMVAAQGIAVGDADVVVAGGMENMSLTPYYLFNARNGYRMGHGQLVDGMIHDGLWDVYNNFHMGNAAEGCARAMNISREDQDAFAVESYKRAQAAMADGAFAAEIVPVPVQAGKGDPVMVAEDEEPKKVIFEKVGKLKPVFEKEGTITAANASKINDGAAAVVVMAAEKTAALGLKPQARIVGQASFAHAPADFPTAPAGSIRKVLAKAGLSAADIDLWEINEAFALVALAAIRDLGLDPAKVNVHGGAVALGHPIGASGARLTVTLLHAMQQRNARYGLVSLCIGGGEASAMIVERIA